MMTLRDRKMIRPVTSRVSSEVMQQPGKEFGRISMWMDYFEALHNGGWLNDPTDRVQVVAVHESGCPGGTDCRCIPRLGLRPAGNPPVECRRSNVVAGPGWLGMDAARVG